MQTKKREKSQSFIAFIGKSKHTLSLVIIVAIISVILSSGIAILSSSNKNLTVPSTGSLRTIGVEIYWDQNSENRTESINWSDVWLGSSKNVTLYIRSVSNYKITLDLQVTNWSPSILSEYASLSWDYNGTTINPNEIIEVTLTLSIPKSQALVSHLISEKIHNFNLDINITAA